MVEVKEEVYPISEGHIIIKMHENDAKCLLCDLESNSKQHRKSTEEIKALLKGFLEHCINARSPPLKW